MQMDRLLAPTRPFNTVLRPGDGKVPERIAYVSCTGSRDKQVGNPLCSKFCCMYSIKQNQLIMGALPLADVTMHYMDMRAAGKRYDEFYEQAKDMGAQYIKGRVSKITEQDERRPACCGTRTSRTAAGSSRPSTTSWSWRWAIQPNRDVERLFADEPLWGWTSTPTSPSRARTSTPARRTSPASSSPAPRRAPRTSSTRSSTPGAAVAQVAAHLETRSRAVGEEVPA